MLKKTFYLIAIGLAAWVAYLSYEFISYSTERNNNVHEKGQEVTNSLKNEVDSILAKIVTEGNRLAEIFGSQNLGKKEIEKLIRESALGIPEIQGVTACYEPYALSASTKLYCPYYNKGDQSYLFVEDSYDYTVIGEGTAWYTGVRDNGAKWVEPYFARAAQDWYVDYGIPFYYSSGPNKGEVRGTITMSFVASGFKKVVHDLSIGKTGYGIITSNEHTFLVHPINEYVGTRSLNDVLNEEIDPKMKEVFSAIKNGESGEMSYFDKGHDDQALFYYDKIPSSGWGMGLVFYKEDLLNDAQAMNRRYIRLAIFISLLLITLLAIFYGRDHLDENEIWILSILTSILFLSNLCFVGYLTHTTKAERSIYETKPIIDKASASSFVNQVHNRAATLKIPKATPIPTGIFIERMEFQDSYNLNVSGTVWQKYPEELVDSVNVGFVMPQLSPFSEAAYIEESYRKVLAGKEGEGNTVLVGWEFRVTLLLNINYGDFPFDKRHISIELQPIANSDHLIFTPDLSSYKFTNPSNKSGLAQNIRISGSEVLESYFNYTLNNYDTDFGFGEKQLFEEVPVLHYNINIRRKLLNAFVTYLIPIFVTLIMVFILIQACVKTEERQGIIESMAAFFFVLIFSHIDLRKEIITADLIFMEYFYFVSYFMLIISTFNLVTYAKDKSAMFDWHDNLIFKALYVPLFLLIIMVIALWNFY